MKKYYLFVFYSLLLSVCLSGCPKRPLIKPPEIKPPEVKTPVIEEIPEEVKVSEPEIREKEVTIIPQLKTIYFDFDKHNLLPEAQRILQSNAEFLKKNPDLKILLGRTLL